MQNVSQPDQQVYRIGRRKPGVADSQYSPYSRDPQRGVARTIALKRSWDRAPSHLRRLAADSATNRGGTAERRRLPRHIRVAQL